MSNPFEDENGVYHVLINEDGQHSLWPAFVNTPAGWRVLLEKGSRQSCLDFIEAHWTDMRPTALVEAMNRSS